MLSKRLTAIGAMVTPGSVLADIGTDHALLPVELVRNGRIPSAIAMDINKGPLARAREGIVRSGLQEKIITRLSDGFDALNPGEADSAVIAGMGGDLMIRILTRGMETALSFREIICSPQSEIARVRAFARSSGFWIDAEDMVLEDGKYYQIFRLKTECRPAPEAEADVRDVWDHYGEYLIRNRNPVLAHFLAWERELNETILQRLEKNGDGNAERKREICEHIERIGKAQQMMNDDE